MTFGDVSLSTQCLYSFVAAYVGGEDERLIFVGNFYVHDDIKSALRFLRLHPSRTSITAS